MFQLILSAAAALAQGEAPYACNQYEAAIAPLDGTSILCGVGIRDGNIVHLRRDGTFDTISEAPEGPEGSDRFWVMKTSNHWNKWLMGIQGPSGSFLYTIFWQRETGPYDPGHWTFTRVPCGENGADHVYSEYDPRSAHLLAAYRSEGFITVCAFDTLYGSVDTFTLEQDDYIGPLEELSVQWRYCGESGGDDSPGYPCFSVLGPNGDEWLRYDSPFARY